MALSINRIVGRGWVILWQMTHWKPSRGHLPISGCQPIVLALGGCETTPTRLDSELLCLPQLRRSVKSSNFGFMALLVRTQFANIHKLHQRRHLMV